MHAYSEIHVKLMYHQFINEHTMCFRYVSENCKKIKENASFAH